ncbi:MAG: ribosome maturation factor RimM [Herbaspirillum sp.]|jgi:16S rRNA processing protein RimM|nr:ribosome maturation factor RimM [Herbaspirillum sp.]
MAQSGIPEDLVTVGYVTGAYGIAGWVRVKPFSDDADALLGARRWWLNKPESASSLRDIDMLQAKSHGGDVVAQLMGVAGRDAAEALKGHQVQISRSHFPALSNGEFYWVDLIGLSVENMQGEQLGTVADLMDNGAHPILRVVKPVAQVVIAAAAVETSELAAAQSKARSKATPAPVSETLIPFVDHFVKTVDQAAKKITVDWELDY